MKLPCSAVYLENFLEKRMKTSGLTRYSRSVVSQIGIFGGRSLLSFEYAYSISMLLVLVMKWLLLTLKE